MVNVFSFKEKIRDKVPQLKGKIVDRVVFWITSGLLVIAVVRWVISLF